MKTLIFVFIVVETALILLFGLLLYITGGFDPGTFEARCIASARAITDLGNWSDSQFNWLYGDSVMSMDIAVQGVAMARMVRIGFHQERSSAHDQTRDK